MVALIARGDDATTPAPHAAPSSHLDELIPRYMADRTHCGER
jgi:hypothetical protein